MQELDWIVLVVGGAAWVWLLWPLGKKIVKKVSRAK